jgi:hypothetical protein
MDQPDLVVVTWDALIRETVLMPSYRHYAARRSASTVSSQLVSRFQLTPVWSTIPKLLVQTPKAPAHPRAAVS